MPTTHPHHPHRDLLGNIRDTLDLAALTAYHASATNQYDDPGESKAGEACAAMEWDPLYLTLTEGTDHVTGSGYLALVTMEQRLRERYDTIHPFEDGWSGHNPPWAHTEFHQEYIPDALSTLDKAELETDEWYQTARTQEYALSVYYGNRAFIVRTVLKLGEWGIVGRWADLRARYGGGAGGAYTALQRHYLRPVLALDLDVFNPAQKGADFFQAVADWVAVHPPRVVTSWRNIRGRYEACGAWQSGESFGQNRARVERHAREAHLRTGEGAAVRPAE